MHATPCHATPCHATPRRVTPCHTAPRNPKPSVSERTKEAEFKTNTDDLFEGGDSSEERESYFGRAGSVRKGGAVDSCLQLLFIETLACEGSWKLLVSVAVLGPPLGFLPVT